MEQADSSSLLTGSRLPPFPSFSYEIEQANLKAGTGKYRIIQSCTACRKRKSKCDKVFPCGPCVSRNVGDRCMEYEKEAKEGYTGYAHLADFDSLVKQTRALHEAVRQLHHPPGTSTSYPMLQPFQPQAVALSGVDSEIDIPPALQSLHHEALALGESFDYQDTSNAVQVSPGPVSIPRVAFNVLPSPEVPSLTPIRAGEGTHFYHSRPPSRAESFVADYNAAMVLEDLALNRTGNLERKADVRGLGLADGKGKERAHADPAGGLSANYRAKRCQQDWKTVNMPDLECLPNSDTSARILSHFIQEVEWQHRCFHIPTLRNKCQSFTSTLVQNPLSTSQTLELALFAALLCASLNAMDSRSLRDLGYSEDQRDSCCRQWSDLMELALVKGGYMQSHRVETLQAWIVIGPYWHSTHRSESHWTMLGSMVKIAHNLELSHLGAEPGMEASAADIEKRFGAAWIKASDREVGRRIWYIVLDYDWTLCQDHHFTTVTPFEYQSALEPANVDDEDLVGHGPICGRPMTERTSMSFFLSRLRFLKPLHSMDHQIIMSVGLAYKFVQEAHVQYLEVSRNLPLFYHLQADLEDYAEDAQSLKRLLAERHLLDVEFSLRLMKLHRIYLPLSLISEKKYALSKTSALLNARNVLQHARRIATIANLGRAWVVNYAILTATSVLFNAYFHAKESEEAEYVDMIRTGIQVLRQHTSSGSALGNASITINKLLEDEISYRTRTRSSGVAMDVSATASRGQKRNLDTADDGFENTHKLLKRLMVPSNNGSSHRVGNHGVRPSETIEAALPDAASSISPHDGLYPACDHTVNFDFLIQDLMNNTQNWTEQGWPELDFLNMETWNPM